MAVITPSQAITTAFATLVTDVNATKTGIAARAAEVAAAASAIASALSADVSGGETNAARAARVASLVDAQLAPLITSTHHLIGEVEQGRARAIADLAEVSRWLNAV
jgi:hypothetical protein